MPRTRPKGKTAVGPERRYHVDYMVMGPPARSIDVVVTTQGPATVGRAIVDAVTTEAAKEFYHNGKRLGVHKDSGCLVSTTDGAGPVVPFITSLRRTSGPPLSTRGVWYLVTMSSLFSKGNKNPQALGPESCFTEDIQISLFRSLPGDSRAEAERKIREQYAGEVSVFPL